MDMLERGLSDEQRMMRESCRAFVDDFVTPFIRQNWQREWLMDPDARLPAEILEQADRIGIRTLAVPEEYGGTQLDAASEVRSFALIAEEIARGDSGLADKLVQNWKVSVLLRKFAPKHLQDRWFPRLVKEPSFLLAHCLTEPRGASDRWLPYNVPEAAMHTKAVAEEIARGDSGLADKLVQNWKVSVLLRKFAPTHLQARWFPRLVKEPSFLLAHCLTEPRGASDRWLPYNVPEAAMHTKAVADGG